MFRQIWHRKPKKSRLRKALGDVGYLRGIGSISDAEADVIISVILSSDAEAREDLRREARQRRSGKEEPKDSA